jgi:hypothetical protein
MPRPQTRGNSASPAGMGSRRSMNCETRVSQPDVSKGRDALRRRYAHAIPSDGGRRHRGAPINASGATAAGRSGAVTLKGSQPAAANSTPRVGSVASGSRIDFEVQLKPSAGSPASSRRRLARSAPRTIPPARLLLPRVPLARRRRRASGSRRRAAVTTTRRSTPRCHRTGTAIRRILRGRPAATRRRSFAARTT